MSFFNRLARQLCLATTFSAVAAGLVACGGNDSSQPAQTSAQSDTVAKATCGNDDRAETGLQGQIPMAERAAGFKGFNCNLKVVSAGTSSRGEALWEQFALVHDKSGHTCGYAGGAFLSNPGTTVMDLTNPAAIVETAVLKTAAMLNPGEGLRVHEGRGLLVTAFYNKTTPWEEPGAPGFDVYDVGTDCRHPQVLASSTNIRFSTAGIEQDPTKNWPAQDLTYGHEGAISADGLTYYIGDTVHGAYHAIDISDPTAPKLISTFQNPSIGPRPADNPTLPRSPLGGAHGLSVSDDGNRGYMVLLSWDPTTPGGMVPQAADAPWQNGYMTVDTSEIQARKPNARMRFISAVSTRDASAAQTSIPVKINGHRFQIAMNEGGAGQLSTGGVKSACSAGVTPYGTVQFFDMSDETHPSRVNKIVLEANDPKNCGAMPEIASIEGFVYDVHMCSVDNRDDATTLACGYFQSGVRVYDIRDPAHIKEIAYFNPPALAGKQPGQCAAYPILDIKTGLLFSRCSDTGIFALKFTNNVWPLRGSSTPVDKQL